MYGLYQESHLKWWRMKKKEKAEQVGGGGCIEPTCTLEGQEANRKRIDRFFFLKIGKTFLVVDKIDLYKMSIKLNNLFSLFFFFLSMFPYVLLHENLRCADILHTRRRGLYIKEGGRKGPGTSA